MRACAFFGSKKLMVPGATLGATFSPGFSGDLSSWRLIIDDEGNLFQDVDVWQWTEKHGIVQEQRQEQVHIGQDGTFELLLKAEEIGFLHYQDSYSVPITDLPLYQIAVHFGTNKAVEVYGPGALIAEGNQDIKGFLELWNAIHHKAPFPPK